MNRNDAETKKPDGPVKNQLAWLALNDAELIFGAGSRNRTDTPFQARDFESRASTNFAIPATPAHYR